jgi:hypothetical protein
MKSIWTCGSIGQINLRIMRAPAFDANSVTLGGISACNCQYQLDQIVSLKRYSTVMFQGSHHALAVGQV